jgi:hypothetical protein
MAAWIWLSRERVAASIVNRALAYRHPGWMNNQANTSGSGSAIISSEETGKGGSFWRRWTTAGPFDFGQPVPRNDPSALDLRLAEIADARVLAEEAELELEADPPGGHGGSCSCVW